MADLWDLAADGSSFEGPNDVETTVFFVGGSKTGKSTVIQSFLKPSVKKEPKPTFSLEYNYARKKAANGKALAHIWEMGGDINEPKLMNVPITSKTLDQGLTTVVCVDLSQPQNIISHTRYWIRMIRTALESAFGQLRSEQSDRAQEIIKESKAAYSGHTDSGSVKPSPVPLILMATKYDTLRAGSISTGQRRLIFQCLRFVAHYYGAVLMCSGGDSSSLRGSLATVCFSGGRALRKGCDVGSDKMVYVSAGADSYDAILGSDMPVKAEEPPSSPTKEGRLPGVIEEGSSAAPNENSWRALARHLEEAFGAADATPSASVSTGGDGEVEGSGAGGSSSGRTAEAHPEPEIDDERNRRRQFLERYVAEEARKEALHRKIARSEQATANNNNNNSSSSSRSSRSRRAETKDDGGEVLSQVDGAKAVDNGIVDGGESKDFRK